MVMVCRKFYRFTDNLPPKSDLKKEVEELWNHLENLNSPVVFCHNDLLPANIIYNREIGIYSCMRLFVMCFWFVVFCVFVFCLSSSSLYVHPPSVYMLHAIFLFKKILNQKMNRVMGQQIYGVSGHV